MESIEKGDDDSGLKSLIDLAEACPKFLRPQLDQLFAACIKVFSDTNQEDSWRHLALEIVVTMSETAPAMVRKVAGGQLEAAIAAILRMMTEIDEEDDWATSDEAADDDSDSKTFFKIHKSVDKFFSIIIELSISFEFICTYPIYLCLLIF